jgi:replicative DNA helicase
MSVTELPQRGEEFERMPPHDVAAEQCVLGGMLLSKDAISDVIEVIRPTDHYRPAHQLVHEAILDLYARGEPADPITVANELTRRGELSRIGGAPYLHTLIASVPTAANAGYYARIVRERAILRRLVEAGTRIVQFGYAGDGDADELVDRAQAEVYAVTDRRIAEDYHPLSEIMPQALEEIEAIGAHGGGLSGVPTGFSDLDALTNGLHAGQMVVIAARPAVGKALALDTPLPTPAGWTTMGEVRVGDYLIDANGKPTRVLAATGVLHGRPCYEVEFSDGSVIIADENHQWQTWIRPDTVAPPTVVTTGEIAGSLPRHAVALTHAADLPAGAPRETRWRFITDVRPVFPRPVRCVQVDNEDELYLAGRGMIPTHNSALALDFARSATIRHGLPTVVFSLEMGRNEITMRLLSAEARVPMHIMRTGQMSDDDWGRLAKRMSEVADAPLFIDDSPNMSLMEIRAKCRRLKQRHDLKLVIIDYLQLMSTPGKVESRQQEVSAMSRSLKLLAKELEVPVVALSQLNRGPEQRQDKKPMLSDLRESGCLTGDTRILRADTGTEITLDELITSGARDIPVWSLDDRMRLVPSTLTHAFSSGTKEVFRVRLTSGREIQATANHPFLTFAGWKHLEDLAVGTRVAIPRATPGPLVEQSMPEHEIIMLAHLLGDGSFVRHQPIRDASLSLRSHEKFFPDWVFSLPQEQLALFLRHLWATDGSSTVAKSGLVRIYFGTASERMARQLLILLLRFGIVARLYAVGNSYGHPQWTVDVSGVEYESRFLDAIGAHGPRVLSAAKVRERPREMTAAGRFDTVPVTRIAEDPEDSQLKSIAESDVFWDTIASIESIGTRPVYDATVLGTHNFVANGINLHNSIEQDADVVILLHREDAYERESPRAGEADLIVAKHRNGPTATVTVAFQGHYSRFVDMAPG